MRSYRVLLVLSCCSLAACSRNDSSSSTAPQAEARGSRTNAKTTAKVSRVEPDGKAIFDAIILDVLTNPNFESEREFYGTPGDRRFALVSSTDYGITWPDWFAPSSVEGFESTRAIAQSPTDPNLPRLLGIRLNKFDLEVKPNATDVGFLDGQIHITIFNAGGTGGDILHKGGCSVYYDAKHDGNKWTIHFKGLVD